MESLDKAASFVEVDDLLDFASDIGEGDDEEDKNKKPLLSVNPSGHKPVSFIFLGAFLGLAVETNELFGDSAELRDVFCDSV